MTISFSHIGHGWRNCEASNNPHLAGRNRFRPQWPSHFTPPKPVETSVSNLIPAIRDIPVKLNKWVALILSLSRRKTKLDESIVRITEAYKSPRPIRSANPKWPAEITDIKAIMVLRGMMTGRTYFEIEKIR